MRQLLDRIEDKNTGEILVPELHGEIHPKIKEQIKETADLLGDMVWKEFPFFEVFYLKEIDISEN